MPAGGLARRARHPLAVAVLSVFSAPVVAGTDCVPGYWDNGGTCTAASLGHYVAGFGATAQVPASIGYYVGITGATAQSPSLLGHYVDTTAATAPVPCLPGRYASTTAATVCAIAQIGYFAAGPAATGQTPAPLGFYVASVGARSFSATRRSANSIERSVGIGSLSM